jgi:hypothetical protein
MSDGGIAASAVGSNDNVSLGIFRYRGGGTSNARFLIGNDRDPWILTDTLSGNGLTLTPPGRRAASRN